MDYEKAYKEALEHAKKCLKDGGISQNSIDYIESIFPELKESEDEEIRQTMINFFKSERIKDGIAVLHFGVNIEKMISWLEKQGEKPSAIRWYNVSLIPQEMEELLVEWDSEDATWHEIAFYHADTKTFWNGTRQVENVTRWCYITDLLEKQGDSNPTNCSEEHSSELLKIAKQNNEPSWSEEDEHRVKDIIYFLETAKKHYASTVELDACIDWLKSLKERLKGE